MLLTLTTFLIPAALAVALPQGPPGGPGGPGGGPPSVAPTVDSLTMVGPGCPLGAGGLVQEVRNGTPVFLFTEWNLDLKEADPAAEVPVVDKFCQETIKLGNGPVGMQVRISQVTIGGWASLATGSKLSIAVDTRLGNTTAGVSNHYPQVQKKSQRIPLKPPKKETRPQRHEGSRTDVDSWANIS
jgi:hypothetical protein